MSGMKHAQPQAVPGACLAPVALLTLTMLVPGWRLRQDMEFSITALHHS
jgi:hypothetical protein